MRTKTFLAIALAFTGFAFSACSFSTANASELKFGKNDTAKSSATSFNVGENVFAVATFSNATGKHKLKFNLKYYKEISKKSGTFKLTGNAPTVTAANKPAADNNTDSEDK